MLTTREILLSLGDKAIQHARTRIRQGNTFLDANNLSDNSYESLKNKIISVRMQTQQIYQLNVPLVDQYEAIINLTKDIGNCDELSYHAFDYFLENAPAELYFEMAELEDPADHVFVILGRDPDDSVTQQPISWGDNTLICDAYTNDKFFAPEYKDKLKNLTYQKTASGRLINQLENFDANKHPIHIKLNSAQMRAVRTIKSLKKNFPDHLRQLQIIIDEYQNTLQALETRLLKKYEGQHKKVQTVQEKLAKLSLLTEDIKDLQNTVVNISEIEKYRIVHQEMYNRFASLITTLQSITLTEEDKKSFSNKWSVPLQKGFSSILNKVGLVKEKSHFKNTLENTKISIEKNINFHFKLNSAP